VYESFCIPGVYVCILWCRRLCVDVCLVIYIVHIYVCTLGVGVCVVCQVLVHVLHGVV